MNSYELRIAELEKQRDALVAENVALKVANKKLISEQQAAWPIGLLESFIAEHEPETTATDAAIAEIGARAVDDFCSALGEHYKNFKPNSIQGKTIKWSVMQGVSYANKLRGGGA